MLVVVGGHARKTGKTSVICGIVSALRSWRWTAIKITPHDHPPSAHPDTDRYLAAGADRAVLIRTSTERPDVPGPGSHVIVESNRALDLMTPDLVLMVIDESVGDFKEGSERFRERADALVYTSAAVPRVAGRTVCHAPPPRYVSSELIELIRATNAIKLPGGSADIPHRRWLKP